MVLLARVEEIVEDMHKNKNYVNVIEGLLNKIEELTKENETVVYDLEYYKEVNEDNAKEIARLNKLVKNVKGEINDN